MKLLTTFFSKVYSYVTVFIVIASPLFFIPKTSFSPEVTYQITLLFAVTLALIAYIIQALLSKTWHTISKLEFLSYTLFIAALIGSVAFSRNPQAALFGEAFSAGSAASLAILPVVMYLVRALPERLRHVLKVAMLTLLAVSALTFIVVMIFSGKVATVAALLFGGFGSAISLAVYIGIFVVAMFFALQKAHIRNAYKTAIALAAVVIIAWTVSIVAVDGPRPNLESSLIVGKGVLLHDGVFGIGAGSYTRAWQLYRPSSVIVSPYFGSDFDQAFGTTTTLLATLGVFGMLAFLLLTVGALYSTYRSYKDTPPSTEKDILGALTLILLYFAVISWVVPLSYAMLVVWMVVAGLGVAKAKLTVYHPHKKMAYILIPVAILFVAHSYLTVNKARAFISFSKAGQLFSTGGVSPQVDELMSAAIATYPYDGFYRSRIEYIITLERALVAKESKDQEALKKEYLENAAKAVDAGIAAVTLGPNNYQNYVSLGRAYELAIPFDKEGGYTRAKKSYEEAIKLYPENPYLYVMLARLEAQSGSKEGVRAELKEALKKKQNFADALYLMSQLEASEQNVDEALTYALEAVKNAPNDPLVYTQAGLLLYGKKNYQDAVTVLQAGLKKDPNNANIAYFLALSLRDGGRPDLAKQIGEELLRRNPGNADLEAFLKSIEATSEEKVPATSTPKKK